jgi:hypothetical protein
VKLTPLRLDAGTQQDSGEAQLGLTDELATGRARTGGWRYEIHLIDLVQIHGTDRHIAVNDRRRHGREGSHWVV